jgi:hypothetical protein
MFDPFNKIHKDLKKISWAGDNLMAMQRQRLEMAKSSVKISVKAQGVYEY